MASIGACAFALAAAFVVTRGRKLRLVLGVTGAAFAATMLMAVAGVSGGVGSGGGLEREVGDLSIFGLRANELVVPSAQNLFIGDRLEAYHESRRHGSNATETENYVGLLTIALALGWLVVAWRRRRELSGRVAIATAGLAGVVLTSLLFGLPTPLNVFGARAHVAADTRAVGAHPGVPRPVALDRAARHRARPARGARPAGRLERARPADWPRAPRGRRSRSWSGR